MKDTANLGVADVLAARVDLACVPKTSSGAVRDNTKTKLNKMVIVGKVCMSKDSLDSGHTRNSLNTYGITQIVYFLWITRPHFTPSVNVEKSGL